MENDKLTQIWDSQKSDSPFTDPEKIILSAKKQRAGQFLSITIMAMTILVLVIYGLYTIKNQWNNFSLGLLLMVTSLTFRIALEYISLYRKESQLISLDNISFQAYLQKHYRLRLKVNYIVTPICFATYLYGFSMLLPYFKHEFSEHFYIYILVSGLVSLIVLALIIMKSVLKERDYLKKLTNK